MLRSSVFLAIMADKATDQKQTHVAGCYFNGFSPLL